MHKDIQEPKSDDDSVTDDLLNLASQYLKKIKDCAWGMTTKTIKPNEILYKKQNCPIKVHGSIQEPQSNNDSVTDDFIQVLHHKMLKKIKGCVWGMM